jgi:hypothetical protein
MTDPNQAEVAAMEHASYCGGQFIEGIGRTDMAVWSGDEWQSFISAICGGYVDSLLRQQADVQGAVGKVQQAA